MDARGKVSRRRRPAGSESRWPGPSSEHPARAPRRRDRGCGSPCRRARRCRSPARRATSSGGTPGGTAGTGTGPSHRSQSSVSGTGGVSLGLGHLGEVRPRVAAHRPVGPGVDLGDVADRAVVDPLLEQADRLVGVALVAHLRHDTWHRRAASVILRASKTVCVSGFWQKTCLPACRHGHRDDGVGVVRRRDHHRVDALLLLEHHAVVLVDLGLRVQRDGLRRVGAVDVAQGDDVLALAGLQVGAPHAADADGGDVQLVAGRLRPQHPARDDGGRKGGQGRRRGELPSGHGVRRIVGHRRRS